MFIRPKDYIAIADTLYFAVVSEYQEDGRALCWLRYIKDDAGMHKLSTKQAAEYISKSYPQFNFHSDYADSLLHGIPFESVDKIFRPEATVLRLLNLSSADDKQRDAITIINRLLEAGVDQKNIGITGSLMLDTHNEESDIDIVIYGRKQFFAARKLIKNEIKISKLESLSEASWKDAYHRRGCALTYEQYKKHELRKYNKCISGNTRVDISMIPNAVEQYIEKGPYKKKGRANIVARVTDDTYAYDFPARYLIEHETITEVVSYTATYIGQARTGEQIDVAGHIEQGSDGGSRLLVGTSREAADEYIRIID
jgi:predicted nucleotidyltransferase